LTDAVVVSTPGGPLVPLRSVSQALGGQLQWDAAAKTAAVQYRGRRLDVDERRHRLLLDGQSLAGTAGPQSAHGQLLVPLAAVERLFGVRGEWQPDRGLLKLAAAGSGSGRRGRRDADNPSATAGAVLSLSADKKSYLVGVPVMLTLSVSNAGRAPVTLDFATSQKYDFVVRRSGQTVWRWAAGRMFTQALTNLTLAPGERRTFTERWNQTDTAGRQAPAGEYEAVGILTTMTRPQPQSSPVTLQIGS